MKWILLPIIGIVVVVSVVSGRRIYRLRRQKCRRNQGHEVHTPEHVDTRESEQQRLVKQLYQQREEMAVLRYRQACGKLFEDLSGGIQDLLAQQRRPYSRETVFCHRLKICIENNSLRGRMQSPPTLEKPEAVTPELETANEETLREMIRVERSKCHIPAIEIAWDTLMGSLLPCLERLIQAAEENRGDDCHKELALLKKHLADCKIYPMWYDDEVIQNGLLLQRDYAPTALYPIPALYYCQDGSMLHIGTPGYMKSEEKE